jgi:hypothetical protein
MSSAVCECLLLAVFLRVHGVRAKRGYNCELVERRRLDDGAASPLMIHAFDMADQIADDF